MLDILPLHRVMKMRGRVLWIALLVVFEVAAFWYFLLHASSGEGHAQDPALKRKQSPANVRRCLSERHRDPRFVRGNACVTPSQRVVAIEDLLFELKSVFDTIGIDYWIDSGTLLGQHRTGGVIPWDFNGNVGVMRSGLHLLRETNIELPEGYELNMVNSRFYPQADRVAEIPARWVEHKYGFYVDIFEFVDIEMWNVHGNETIKMLDTLPDAVWNSCWHCPTVAIERAITVEVEKSDDEKKKKKDPNQKQKKTEQVVRTEQVKRFRIPRDWVFPLRTCVYETFRVTCPAKPTEYLTHLYGEDFLEPDLW